MYLKPMKKSDVAKSQITCNQKKPVITNEEVSSLFLLLMFFYNTLSDI